MRIKGMLAAAGTVLLMVAPAVGQELTVWHDLGDNGVAWFQVLSDEFAKDHPGVTVKSISYPTDQWYGKVTSAINTDTAPDLIFNNYERVIRIENQTEQVMDLSALLDTVEDKAFLSDADLSVAKYAGKMIIFPVQRVQMGFGVRSSWLDKVGESYPATWDDAKRIAAKFQTEDPDGNGKADTFGFALEAANPRDLIHMLDLFNFGAGLHHTLIDAEGTIVIDEPQHAEVLKEFLKVFTDYGFVAPDTINHSFAEMYQVIEGGRAGMFRVGDWNVKKWDGEATLSGDFEPGPWPAFFEGTTGSVVIGGMRGIAIPENSPNKDLAEDFAKFLLTKQAQQASLEKIGAAVRNDLDTSALSPRQQYFAQAQGQLNAYDFPESLHAFYPELEANFHRILLDAIANPPADWDKFIADTAQTMRDDAKKLAAQ